jgi:hypothetical protein
MLLTRLATFSIFWVCCLAVCCDCSELVGQVPSDCHLVLAVAVVPVTTLATVRGVPVESFPVVDLGCMGRWLLDDLGWGDLVASDPTDPDRTSLASTYLPEPPSQEGVPASRYGRPWNRSPDRPGYPPQTPSREGDPGVRKPWIARTGFRKWAGPGSPGGPSGTAIRRQICLFRPGTHRYASDRWN